MWYAFLRAFSCDLFHCDMKPTPSRAASLANPDPLEKHPGQRSIIQSIEVQLQYL